MDNATADLVRRASSGDKPAMEQVVESHRWIVRSLCKEHTGPAGWLPKEDVLQAGYLALVQAVHAYDPARGPFATFAHAWVANEMRRAHSEHADPSYQHLLGDQDVPGRTEVNTCAHRAEFLLSELTEVEQRVVEWHYGLTSDGRLNNTAKGKRLGMSRQGATKILNLAMKKLRAAAEVA